jgi:tetratricopeptide (TPR) repeat protein
MPHDPDAANGSDRGQHPEPGLLERFMRNEAEPAERRWIVRHLIAGCARCLAITSKLWALGDPRLARLRPRPPVQEPGSGHRRQAAAGEPAFVDLSHNDDRDRDAERRAEAYAEIFERLAGVGRRVEEEREAAPRLVAELLASPPAARAALLAKLEAGGSAGPAIGPGSGSPDHGGAAGSPWTVHRVATPAVCALLLERCRAAAATEPAVALQAAELALALAERLDAAVCGATVVQGLRACAWAHLGDARRAGGDLDGAEWALEVAGALATAGAGVDDAGEVDAASENLETLEWARLLVFKAALRADRGDLGEADRLLERAADLYGAAGERRRAGRALVQQGLIRVELGDRERAVELLRAAVDLLDLAFEPRLVADTLCRLAALLCGIPHAADASRSGSAIAAAGSASPSASPAGPGAAAAEASAPSPLAASPATVLSIRCAEALQLLGRAQALYKGLDDAAAQGRLSRLLGQIEAALGRLDAAEATLLAACAALAQGGLGREAAQAQVELALVLARQGRTGEIRRLGLMRRPQRQARDKSWAWFSCLLVFQRQAEQDPDNACMLSELARYLAPRSPAAWTSAPSPS